MATTDEERTLFDGDTEEYINYLKTLTTHEQLKQVTQRLATQLRILIETNINNKGFKLAPFDDPIHLDVHILDQKYNLESELEIVERMNIYLKFFYKDEYDSDVYKQVKSLLCTIRSNLVLLNRKN